MMENGTEGSELRNLTDERSVNLTDERSLQDNLGKQKINKPCRNV